MMLAEIPGSVWIPAASVIGGLVGVGVTQLIRLMSARYALKKSARMDVVDEWRNFSQEQEKQSERLNAVIHQQQLTIEAMWQSLAGCRSGCAEARVCILFLYDLLKRLHTQLVKLGQSPGDLPDLPKFEEQPPADAEFLARQAAQSAELAHKASEVVSAAKPEVSP